MIITLQIFLSLASAWQSEVLVKIHSKSQMQEYLRIKKMDAACKAEAMHLYFPEVCGNLLNDLAKAKYQNQYEIKVARLEFETNCENYVTSLADVNKLLLLEKHVVQESKCKILIEERLKDLLYAKS